MSRYTRELVAEILRLAGQGMASDRIALRVGRPERAIRTIVATAAAPARRRDRRNRRVASPTPPDLIAAAQRAAAAERRESQAAICPPSISAQPFTDAWFAQCERVFAEAFRRGRALELSEREEAAR